MIVFVLIVMIGNNVVHKDLEFYDVDRCKYFANRLNTQPPIPNKNGKPKRITAYCQHLTKK